MEAPFHADGLAKLTTLPGVGPALSKSLEKLGLLHVQDLWFHLPLRYEDRTRLTPIADLRPGESALVEGVIEAIEKGFRFRPQLRIAISDGSQQTLVLRFFHFHAGQIAQLSVGSRLRCYGEIRYGAQGCEIIHPQYTRIADDAPSTVEETLTPVYPTTEGLGQKRIASVVGHALDRLPRDGLELIPVEHLKPLGLASLYDALLTAHRPPPDADVGALTLGVHPAQRRLAFEELLARHLGLARQRNDLRRHAAPALKGDASKRKRLLKNLPFALTGAQKRVSIEIADDLKQPVPMLRLVQGDVGSGKTVVAAIAALNAVEAGYQVAIMAPTELLAEQHLRAFRDWFEPLGIDVIWLAGKVHGKARTAALNAVAKGATVVVGTHALMQEAVVFNKLGLAIIDEQHRFGVHQRLALRDKGLAAGNVPHQLVMTATPIPRTLAMTAYADLDISVIDELPPGRTPVQTVAISTARRNEVIERVRAACAEGRQIYWVCTLIEESEQLEAQAAEVAYAELGHALAGVPIGLIHGRMKPKEKADAMAAFKAGDLKLLVATTVIEVGVDVPNASLMVIENAERLGLAQLHQLRGRVGRGSAISSCVLLYRPPLSALARQRLEVMRETNDGFRIAEKDLELRGPGEVLGTRQTGQMEFRIADLARDADLLPAVQALASDLLEHEPARAEQIVARWVGGATRYAGA